MPNVNTDKHKSIVTVEAIAKNRRVKLDASQLLTYADAGEDFIGISIDAAASGAPCAIKLPNDGGTFLIEAAAGIVAGATVYGANDGKIDDSASGDPIGEALEVAGAAGVMVEVLFVKTSGLVQSATIADAAVTIAGPAVTATGPAITGSGPAATDAVTFTHSWNGSTDPSAAEGAAIIADLDAFKVGVDANNAAIDANIVDIAANNAAIDALIVDVAANNAEIDAAVTDITAIVTKLNAVLLALETSGILASS